MIEVKASLPVPVARRAGELVLTRCDPPIEELPRLDQTGAAPVVARRASSRQSAGELRSCSGQAPIRLPPPRCTAMKRW